MGTLYAPRIRAPSIIERAKIQTLQLPVYRDGAIVAPTGGNFSLKDENGSIIVSPTAISISGSIAQFALGVADIPATTKLGTGFLEYWDLVIGGSTYNFKRPSIVARSSIYPCISDIDLIAQYSDLASLLPATMSSFQNYIDEAWYQIFQRLTQEGSIVTLILDPQSLRMIHVDLSLWLIFKDFNSSGLGPDGQYFETAKAHKREYETGWKRLTFRYDQSEVGYIADPNKRRPALSQIFTSAPPPFYRRRWRRF